jgi:DnaJ-domain-containing protein 1
MTLKQELARVLYMIAKADKYDLREWELAQLQERACDLKMSIAVENNRIK